MARTGTNQVARAAAQWRPMRVGRFRQSKNRFAYRLRRRAIGRARDETVSTITRCELVEQSLLECRSHYSDGWRGIPANEFLYRPNRHEPDAKPICRL